MRLGSLWLHAAALTCVQGLGLPQDMGARPALAEVGATAPEPDNPMAQSLDHAGQAGVAPGTSRTIGGASKDADAKRIESTAAGLAPGGVLGVDAPGAPDIPNQVAASDPASLPELHVVQNGDTLWSLCSKYYGDPWRWPRLWAANPAITNPHWIFPGDVIRIGGSAAGPAKPATTASVPVAEHGRLTSVNRIGSGSEAAIMLRTVGFIEAKDLDQAAIVSGSREEKIILSTSDTAYLRYAKNAPLRAGERYSVFETDLAHPIVDESTGKTYGYLVRILGDLIVNQIADNQVARALLVDTINPIERGARVSKFVRQFRRIEPKPSSVNLEARVIATFAPNQLLSTGSFVVLNRGKRDGVEVGNRTFVVRRGDGYATNIEEWEIHDPTSPKEVVGEILVVEVRDNASVAWVARSNKELRVGELTEMRKGH